MAAMLAPPGAGRLRDVCQPPGRPRQHTTLDRRHRGWLPAVVQRATRRVARPQRGDLQSRRVARGAPGPRPPVRHAQRLRDHRPSLRGPRAGRVVAAQRPVRHRPVGSSDGRSVARPRPARDPPAPLRRGGWCRGLRLRGEGDLRRWPPVARTGCTGPHRYVRALVAERAGHGLRRGPPGPPRHVDPVRRGRDARPSIGTGRSRFPRRRAGAAPGDRVARCGRGSPHREPGGRGPAATASGRAGRRVPQRRPRLIADRGPDPPGARRASGHIRDPVRRSDVRRDGRPATDGGRPGDGASRGHVHVGRHPGRPPRRRLACRTAAAADRADPDVPAVPPGS